MKQTVEVTLKRTVDVEKADEVNTIKRIVHIEKTDVVNTKNSYLEDSIR